MKVTTFHEYEMDDCNPTDLFGKAKSEQDILNFFAKQAKPEAHEKSREYDEDIEMPANKFTRK